MADQGYQRRPSMPPPRPPSTEERLTRLETNLEHMAEDVEHALRKLGALGDKFDGLNTNVAILVSQRDDAKEGRNRWKNWVLGIASSLAVALIIFLATMAWNVQTNRLPAP